VATKRVLRAILKAADLCTSGPERVARLLVDKGYTSNYDYARETMQEVVYRQWREYNPEDTVRLYALRLHEAGMLKSSPQKFIAHGTDWRFLNELKQELKGEQRTPRPGRLYAAQAEIMCWPGLRGRWS
jgi:NitT/TauT family transport system substrate-binding protein